MAKITVSVPDEVYRQAKIRAEEQGCSVSSLVTEYLASLSAPNDHFDRLLAEQEGVFQEIESFRGGDCLNRDEVHDRAVR